MCVKTCDSNSIEKRKHFSDELLSHVLMQSHFSSGPKDNDIAAVPNNICRAIANMASSSLLFSIHFDDFRVNPLTILATSDDILGTTDHSPNH